jgi:hypothetical protein
MPGCEHGEPYTAESSMSRTCYEYTSCMWALGSQEDNSCAVREINVGRVDRDQISRHFADTEALFRAVDEQEFVELDERIEAAS